MYSPTLYLENKPIIQLNNISSTTEVIDQISEYIKLLPSEFYLTHDGKILSQISEEFIINRIDINIRIFGGKGGFGSMLRAIGAQIEKTTNREACRDLSGRRLRDINEEKRLKSWLDKQKDRDAEAKERKRKKLEKLTAVPKHEFKDSEYESIRAEMTENVSDAVEEGFKKAAMAAKTTAKRKAIDNGASKSKKASLWIDDISSSSDTDDSDSDTDIAKSTLKELEKFSHEDVGEGSSKMSKDDDSNSSEDVNSVSKNSSTIQLEKITSRSSEDAGEGSSKMTTNNNNNNSSEDLKNSSTIQLEKNSTSRSSEDYGEGSSKMSKDDDSNSSEDVNSVLKNSSTIQLETITSRSSEDAGEGSSKMSKDDNRNRSEDANTDLKNSNTINENANNQDLEDENSSSGGSAIEK